MLDRLTLALLPALTFLACAEQLEPAPETEPEPAYEIAEHPPLDFTRSPHTGWTRAHYEALFARIIDGWSRHLSPGGARSQLPGDPDYPQQLEGVTRMLPLLGAWLSNPDNPERVTYRNREHDLLAYARDIILHGTDPTHDESWGPIIGSKNQAQVEALFVAEFLIETRERFWDTLEPEQRDQIMTWLAPVSDSYTNNWELIMAVREEVRRALGYPIDELRQILRLQAVEQHHIGDGWFRDGDSIDFYNGFIIHAEWLWWAQIGGVLDPALRERALTRTRAWLRELPYLMAPNGAMPVMGRSLVYRSAHLAPVGLAARFGVDALEPGVARRMLSANLGWHLGEDLLATDRMLDDDNLIRMGYIGEDPNAAEIYHHPGSQYLVTRALTVLALSDDHPFWTTTEGALPGDAGDFDHALPGPGFHLQHRDGVIVLDNTRGWSDYARHLPRHAKLAYASELPFTATAPDDAAAIDAMVLPSPDGLTFEVRRQSLDVELVRGYAGMRFELSALGGVQQPGQARIDEVRTAVVTFNEGRVRLSCVASGFGAALDVYEGSFASSAEWLDEAVDDGGRWSYVQTADAAIALGVLFGYEPPTPLMPWLGDDGRNLVHAADGVMTTRSLASIENGEQCVASVHAARRDAFDPAAMMAAIDSWQLADDQALTLQLSDGAQIWVDVARTPSERSLDLAGHNFEGPLRHARVGGEGWIAAAGARSITSPDWPDFEAIAPTTYACHGEAESIVCELGGPGTLVVPDAEPVASWQIELDGPAELLDITATQIDIDAASFAAYVDATAQTRVRVRLSARG